MSGWLGLALRRLRQDRATGVGVVVLALVTALVVSAAPRLLGRLATDSLHEDVLAASDFARNLQLLQEGSIGPSGPDGLADVRASGDDLAAELPQGVRDLVSDRSQVVDSVRWKVQEKTADPMTLRFRIMEGIEERIHLVAGRAPTAGARSVPPPSGATPGTKENAIEAAVSVETARALGAKVGDTVQLVLDSGDTLGGAFALNQEAYATADIVGIYEVPDETAPFWLDDTSVTRPTVRSLSLDARVLDALAIVAADGYPYLVSGLGYLPFRYTWRFFVDPDRLDAGNLDGLLSDLRRIDSAYPTAQAPGGGTALRSGLRSLIESHQARWLAALAVLSVIGLSGGGIALVALCLVVLLAARPRRDTLALWLARGASRFQVAFGTGLETAVLAGPAVALGAALAIAIIPVGDGAQTVALAAAVAVLVALLLIVASQPRGPGIASRATDRGSRPSTRRRVLEVFLVGLALAGAVLLRSRGIAAAADGPRDPFLALVPALAGLAAGIVAVRLFPLPMRLLGWIAASRRTLVPVLAVRRATQGGTTAAVLGVLLATATLGTFAAAALDRLDRSADSAAGLEVGAPYRLTQGGSPILAGFDPTSLPGVEAVAPLYRGSALAVASGRRAPFLAIDVPGYEAVVGGTTDDAHLPAAFSAPPGGPIPVILGPGVTTGTQGLSAGQEFQLLINGLRLTFRAVEVRSTFPTLPPDGSFYVMPRGPLEAAAITKHAPNEYFVRAPAADAAALAAAARARSPGIVVADRAARADAFRAQPVATALVAGVTATVIVAVAYASLAILAALALGAAGRASEVAHLRVMGLSRRQVIGLAVVEHSPVVLAAFGGGIALGLGLFALLLPGLGLDSVVGRVGSLPITVSPSMLALILGATALMTVLGIALGAMIQRRLSLPLAIRRGME